MKNTDRPIITVYITDEDFSMPTTVSIASLFDNAYEETEIVVYVICDALSETAKSKLAVLGDGINKKVVLLDARHDKYSCFSDRTGLCINHVSHTAVYKFELTDMIPEKKAIYIDGDTVITDDISELWDIDMEGGSILAAVDLLDSYEDGISKMAKGIGSVVPRYYNSGVMVLDLERLRRINGTQRLMEYRLNGINRYMDQDAFNGALYGEIKQISSKYNFMMQVTDFEDIDKIGRLCGSNWESVEECVKDELIIHFAGPIKPWKYNRPWFTDLFLKYYEKAGFSAKELKLLSPLKRLNDDKNWLKAQIKTEKEKGYVFPYEKIKAGSRIIIWGTGNVGKSYKYQLDATSYCEAVLWVDTKDPAADSPEMIVDTAYDHIIIATVRPDFTKEIEEFLIKKLGCDKAKIVKVIS